jgi:hypothetical protein
LQGQIRTGKEIALQNCTDIPEQQKSPGKDNTCYKGNYYNEIAEFIPTYIVETTGTMSQCSVNRFIKESSLELSKWHLIDSHFWP